MNTLNSRSSTPRRRGGVRWWVILLFGLYAAWYWFSNQQEAAFTGRAQLIDSSVQEEAWGCRPTARSSRSRAC